MPSLELLINWSCTLSRQPQSSFKTKVFKSCILPVVVPQVLLTRKKCWLNPFRVLQSLKRWWRVWVPLLESCWWWWWWLWWSLSSLSWWWGRETSITHGNSQRRVLHSWMPCTVVGEPCSLQPRLSVHVFLIVLNLSPKLWHKAWNRNQSLRLRITQHDEPYSSVEKDPKYGSPK